MREKPILFGGDMVRAILAGTKTQTRRIVKPQPPADTERYERQVAAETCIDCEPGTHFFRALHGTGVSAGVICPHGQPGDQLWVKETWAAAPQWDGTKPRDLPDTTPIRYIADDGVWPGRRRPSIFMPRWASRITLEVTGVRVERLQDIGAPDARAEGIQRTGGGVLRWEHYPDYLDKDSHVGSPVISFATLWESINGKRDGCSWEANPWVWVVEFRRLP